MYNRIFWNTLYSQSGIPIELNLARFNRLCENSWYTKFGYDPVKLKSYQKWQKTVGYSPRFFVIFGEKIDFCFNGLKCSFGSTDTWSEKKFEKKSFLEWKLVDEMYNRIFWNTLYSQSGIPIELNLAGFNRLCEDSWYTKFGYDPMKLKYYQKWQKTT
jgi:hypothetical protein